jgi:hypothetical protein
MKQTAPKKSVFSTLDLARCVMKRGRSGDNGSLSLLKKIQRGIQMVSKLTMITLITILSVFNLLLAL